MPLTVLTYATSLCYSPTLTRTSLLQLLIIQSTLYTPQQGHHHHNHPHHPLPQSSHPSPPNPHPHLPPPPHHLPQPSPSLSPFPWKHPPHAHPTNPHPWRPQAHLPPQLTRHPHSHDPWHRSNHTWHRPYHSPPQDAPQRAHLPIPTLQPPDVTPPNSCILEEE